MSKKEDEKKLKEKKIKLGQKNKFDKKIKEHLAKGKFSEEEIQEANLLKNFRKGLKNPDKDLLAQKMDLYYKPYVEQITNRIDSSGKDKAYVQQTEENKIAPKKVGKRHEKGLERAVTGKNMGFFDKAKKKAGNFVDKITNPDRSNESGIDTGQGVNVKEAIKRGNKEKKSFLDRVKDKFKGKGQGKGRG